MKSLLVFVVVLFLALFLFMWLSDDRADDATTETDSKSRSIEELENVVLYMDPSTYVMTGKGKAIQRSRSSMGRVLLPKLPGDGVEEKEPEFVRQSGYLGPESCRECHAEMYEGFIQTAHFKTSALPDADTILGTFLDGEDAVETAVRGLRYDVTCEGDDYFQVVKVDQNGETHEHKERIGIVTGSGNHGQTHLYWKDDRLYELPVSWFTGSGWVNSPGYRDGFANLARPIQSGCVACHATLFEDDVNAVNRFDRESAILGVTCEKCHGPGQEHVEYHQKNPNTDESKFITHPSKLPRERMNDVCGQCHTGKSKLKQSMFGFRPGDNIHDFKSFPEPSADGTTGGGVHSANQHPRLLKSRCYLEDSSMNCATCHNPHQQEHGNVELFSKRCMKCHEMQDCGQFPESGARIASNCIDCHMPKKQDKTTNMVTGDSSVFPEIRDHYIRVEPDATKAVLDFWAAEKTDDSQETKSDQ